MNIVLPILFAALAQSVGVPQPSRSANSTPVVQAPTQPMTVLADALKGRIADYYVDPAVVGLYRNAIDRAFEDGSLNGLTGDALAAKLTTILRAAHPDLHLKIYAPGTGLYGTEDANGEPNLPASTLDAAGWIAPEIAYVRPLAFFNRETDVARLQQFMDEHATARALVIDLRRHRGGELREIDVILADLFAAPTDLLTMTTRPAAWERFERKAPTANLSVVGRDATMVREMHRAIPRSKGARLTQIPVYVLTAKNTASAAEHLALAMKVSRRATLVGETTRGAGHYGDEIELADGFSMFIPYGDTVDPVSGAGWEGTGVTPHIAVPGKEALDYVLGKLGVPKVASPFPAV